MNERPHLPGCPEAPLERELPSREEQKEVKAAFKKVKGKGFCTDAGWYVVQNPPTVTSVITEGECKKCHRRHCVILRKWEQ